MHAVFLNFPVGRNAVMRQINVKLRITEGHRELYADLEKISDPKLRAERIRQLATAFLMMRAQERPPAGDNFESRSEKQSNSRDVIKKMGLIRFLI